MIVLDTNVLSVLMQIQPDPTVVAWLDRQPKTSIWTTSITVLEVRFGLQILGASKRRATLVRGFELLLEKIAHRIAPFDIEAADHASDLMAFRHKKSQPVELRDMMIGGIVIARHAVLATRNVTHFQDVGIGVIDPWKT